MLSKNNQINKLILFFLAIIIIAPPFNAWIKVFLLSVSIVIIFFSELIKMSNKNYFIFIFLVLLFLPKFYLSKSNLIINHVVLPTSPSNNLDYVKKVFPKEMSNILQKELTILENKENLLKKIHQPNNNKKSTLYKNFAFQSENIWTNLDEGKLISTKKKMNFWYFGPSSLNDTNLNFGDRNKKNYQTNLSFPVLFQIKFPKVFENSNLCFVGNLILKDNENNYVLKKKVQKECLKISKQNEYYFLDYDRNLEIKIKKSFLYDNISFFTYLLTFFQIILLFSFFKKYNFFNLFLIISFYFILFLYFRYSLQPISGFSETIYFDRGMDGMAHFGYARSILNNLFQGNYFEAFKGVEETFYYMPLTRYLNSFLMIFFGDTILGSIFLISFFGVVIFYTLNIIIKTLYAKILTSIFLFIPIFESLGFTIINYISFTVDGYGEGLCYLSLLTITYLYFKNTNNFFNLYFIGLLSFIVIGIRPNYIILIFTLFFLMSINFVRKDNNFLMSLKKISFLIIGILPILLIPIHNYFYSGEFTLLVKLDNVQNSYQIKFVDYLNLIGSLPDFDEQLLIKIINHISHYIKIYELWFIIILINLFITLFINIDKKTKNLSLSLIVMHLTYLFFLGDPRYSMGTWLISFLVFIKIFKEKYLLYFNNKIFSAKQ